MRGQVATARTRSLVMLLAGQEPALGASRNPANSSRAKDRILPIPRYVRPLRLGGIGVRRDVMGCAAPFSRRLADHIATRHRLSFLTHPPSALSATYSAGQQPGPSPIRMLSSVLTFASVAAVARSMGIHGVQTIRLLAVMPRPILAMAKGWKCRRRRSAGPPAR